MKSDNQAEGPYSGAAVRPAEGRCSGFGLQLGKCLEINDYKYVH